MNRGYDRDFDYLDLDDESDQEISDSSEDELDIILHGTPEQKRKLQRSLSQKDSSSEDEFEKEMNKELNARVEALESSLISNNESTGSGANSNSTSSNNVLGSSASKYSSKSTDKSRNKDKVNDEVYFDSDEEEMIREGEERVKRKNSEVSNDDLFYDPKMDDEDQKWIDKLRRNHQPKSANSVKPVAKSDAVLNCPACMTTLCLDCQRHSLYKNQYRAMFVMNCNVDTSEVLKQPEVKSKNNKRQKKKKSQQNSDSTSSTSDNQTVNDDSESVHPVKCTECNTVVAVYDKDEIFHFFNVLASHG